VDLADHVDDQQRRARCHADLGIGERRARVSGLFVPVRQTCHVP